MRYRVMSRRLDWPRGALVTTDDLAGCNIDLLVQAGHLAPHVEPPAPKPLKAAQTPAQPDTHQEPEDA